MEIMNLKLRKKNSSIIFSLLIFSILLLSSNLMEYEPFLKEFDIKKIERLPSQSIQCLALNNDKKIYVGLDEGIIRLTNTGKIKIDELRDNYNNSQSNRLKTTAILTNFNNKIIYNAYYLNTFFEIESTNSKFQINTQKYYPLPEKLGVTISAIAKDNDQTIWAITSDGKLFTYHQYFKKKRIKLPNGIKEMRVYKLLFSKKRPNYLIACTSEGILFLDTKKDNQWQVAKSELSIAYDIVETKHSIWAIGVKPNKGGVLVKSRDLIDDWKTKYVKLKGVISRDLKLKKLTIDNNHHLWISSNQGLIKYNIKQADISNLVDPPYFKGYNVSALLYNHYDNSLWVGTLGKGLYKVKEKNITNKEDKIINLDQIDQVNCLKSYILNQVEFKQNHNKILNKYNADYQISLLANYLKQNTSITIIIKGHTNIGKKNSDPIFLEELSLNRANKIKELLEKKGIHKDRIKTMGYGNTLPIYKVPQSELDRRANRRIEVEIICKK